MMSDDYHDYDDFVINVADSLTFMHLCQIFVGVRPIQDTHDQIFVGVRTREHPRD